MAETTYKKGELLLEETVNTNTNTYVFQKQIILNQNVLIIDFNGVEYTCELINNNGFNIYGGYNSVSGSTNFSDYPFIVIYNLNQTTLLIQLPEPNVVPIKIYTAVVNSDSDTNISNDFIINYIMSTPTNSNWNVLSTLLGDGDWSRLKAYVETTPKNMNRQVLKALLGSGSSGSGAVVGTAVVGRDTVG